MKTPHPSLRPDELALIEKATHFTVHWRKGIKVLHNSKHPSFNEALRARDSVDLLAIGPGPKPVMYAVSGARTTFVPPDYPHASPGSLERMG